MGQVYFDHAATAPVRPEVVEAMLPYLHDIWGNPSSLHATGIRAAEGVERARLHAAALIGADAEEIVRIICMIVNEAVKVILALRGGR